VIAAHLDAKGSDEREHASGENDADDGSSRVSNGHRASRPTAGRFRYLSGST
jgi:hypothetical protein